MRFLVVVLIIICVAIFCSAAENAEKEKKREEKEATDLFEASVIAEKKFRYEGKRLHARIFAIFKSVFKDVHVLENMAFKYNDQIYTVPLIAITNNGIVLCEFVDQPGKALFGRFQDATWKIAQSARCAQEISNASMTAINMAMMIKSLTGINTKPIAVVSKYTPSQKQLLQAKCGQRIVREEDLFKELSTMQAHNQQNLPETFLAQAEAKFLQLNEDARS